jgi:hypothetical protein
MVAWITPKSISMASLKRILADRGGAGLITTAVDN